jgi:hypothetical protein
MDNGFNDNPENTNENEAADGQQPNDQTGQPNQQIPDNGKPPEGYFGKVNRNQQNPNGNFGQQNPGGNYGQNWQNNPNGYGDPYSQMGRGVMNQYGRYDGFGGPAGNGTYTPQPKVRKEGGDGIALAAMIFGIISICLFASFINFFTAIMALVFGIIYLTGYVAKHKKQAVSGIVMAVVSIILCFVAWGTFVSSPVMKGMMSEAEKNPNSMSTIYEQVEDYENGEITYQQLLQNLMNGSSNSKNSTTDSDSAGD